MEYRLRAQSRSPAFPPTPLQKYLATPKYKGSFNRRSYQYSPRSMHRVTYLNGQKAKIYNTSYLYPEVEDPEARVDLIGKKNRLLLITPKRHRSTHDLSSSPKKSSPLFESASHGSSLSVPSSPFLSRRFGSEPYKSYSYNELYSPRSPSTPRRPLFSSRRTYSTSDLLYTSPTSRDRFYYDYPSTSNYRRWTSNYDISYIPEQYRSMDALYGYRRAGSYDVLYPPSPSYFDFRPFSRSESGYGGYEFRSRSGSGSIIRSSRSDIGDYHHTTRSEFDFPSRLRHELGEYRPATRSECDFPVRHRGPQSKSECGVLPSDIATRSESGFSITLSDFDNSFTMGDDEVCSISSVEHSHDRSLDNLLMFPMSEDHDRFETDSVVSHDRTLDIINEDENSDPDQEEIRKPGKPAASVSLLSRFEQAERQGRTVGGEEDDDVFRQHTETLYLSDGGNVVERDLQRHRGDRAEYEDDDVLRQHTETIYLADGGNRMEDEPRNDDGDVVRQHTETIYLADGGNRMEDEPIEEEDDVLRQHTETIYLADAGNRMEDEPRNDDGDVVRQHTETLYLADAGNRMEDEPRNDDGDVVRQHTETLYLADAGNRMEDEPRNDDGDVVRQHTETLYLADAGNRMEDEPRNDDGDVVRQHTETLYLADAGNRMEDEPRNDDGDVVRQHTETLYLADAGNRIEDELINKDDDVVRHHTETIYLADGDNVIDNQGQEDDDDVKQHTDTLYLFDGANTQTNEERSPQKKIQGNDGKEIHSDPSKDISVSYNSSRNESKDDDDTVRHHTDTLYLYDGTNSQVGDGTLDRDRTLAGENNNNKDVRSLHEVVAGSNVTNGTPELSLSSEDDTLRHHIDTLYLYDGSDSRIADVERSPSNSDNRNSHTSSRTVLIEDEDSKLRHHTETVTISQTSEIHGSENPENLSNIQGTNEDNLDNVRHHTTTLYIHGENVDITADTPERRVQSTVSDAERDLMQTSDKVTLSQSAEVQHLRKSAGVPTILVTDAVEPEHLRNVGLDTEDRLIQHTESVTISQISEIHGSDQAEIGSNISPVIDNVRHRAETVYEQNGDTYVMADIPERRMQSGITEAESNVMHHVDKQTLSQSAEIHQGGSAATNTIIQPDVHDVKTSMEDEVLRQHTDTVTITQTSEIHESGSLDDVSNLTNSSVEDNAEIVQHQTQELHTHGDSVDIMADTPERRMQAQASEETDQLRQHTDTVTIIQTSEIHESRSSDDVRNLTNSGVKDNAESVQHQTKELHTIRDSVDIMADTPERRIQGRASEETHKFRKHTDKLTFSQTEQTVDNRSDHGDVHVLPDTPERRQQAEVTDETDQLRQHTDIVTLTQTAEICDEKSDKGGNVHLLPDTPERRQQAEVSGETDQLRQHSNFASVTQTAEIQDNKSNHENNVYLLPDTPERRQQAEVSEETDELRQHTDIRNVTQTTEIQDNKSNHGYDVHLLHDTPERRQQAEASEETDQLRQLTDIVTISQTAEVHNIKTKEDKSIHDDVHLLLDTPERRQQAEVNDETDQLRRQMNTFTVSQTSEIFQRDSADEISNLSAHAAKDSVDSIRSQTQTLHLLADNVDILPDTPERRTQANASKEEIELKKNSGSRSLTHVEELHQPYAAADKTLADTPEKKVAAVSDEADELRRHTEITIITQTSNTHQASEERHGNNGVVAGDDRANQTPIQQLEDTDGFDTGSVDVDTEESDNAESDESDENVNEHRKLVYVSHKMEVSSEGGQMVDEKLGLSSAKVEEEDEEIAVEASELDDFEIVNMPSDNVENSDLKSVMTTSTVNDSKTYVQTLELTDSEDRVDMLKSDEIMDSAEYDFESSGEILETAESKFVDMSVTDISQIEKSDEYEVIDGPEPLFTSSTIVEPADRHRYLIQDKTDPDEIDESDTVYTQNISAEYERADHDIWEEFIDEREVTTSSQVHLAEEDSDSDSNTSLGQRSPEDTGDITSDDSDNEQLSSHRQLSQSVDNSLSIKSSLSIDNSLSIPGEGSRSAESLDISVDVNKGVTVNSADGSVTDRPETIDSITAESRSVHRIGESVTVDNLSGYSSYTTLSDTGDRVSQSAREILDLDKSPAIKMDESKAPASSSKLPDVTRTVEMKSDSGDLLEIDEKSRGEGEGNLSGKIETEKFGAEDSQGAEDRWEEADVRLVETDVDFVNQNELTTKTADQPRLKRRAETHTDSKISTKGESSNSGEHENADSIQEEDIPGNKRLEVHDDSKHVTRHDAKLELTRRGTEAHVEEGERGLGRESIDTSESALNISPAANTDTDSQGRGNSQQLLETENVDYGSGSHPSEGSVPVPEESRVVVGGDINRDEEIDRSEGGSEKNNREESGARIVGKTESREELSARNSSDIINSTDRVEYFIEVGETSEKTSKSSEGTHSFGYISENLNLGDSSEELLESEEALLGGGVNNGEDQSTSRNSNVAVVSTEVTVNDHVDNVLTLSGAELRDRLISSNQAEPTVKCALTTLAHSGESGTIQTHSNVTESVGTLIGESERNLTGDITQIHYVKPNFENRQATNVEPVTASIEDSLEQADILNVTGGSLHKTTIVQGDNDCMQQIHKSPQPDLISSVDSVTQHKMADTSSVTEGTDLEMTLPNEDAGLGDELTRFIDRTETTLPLEKKAIIKTRVQYRVKKLTKMVTKTDMDVKKVKKNTTGDAVEHEHLQKVEQLTVVSQKVWSSTESLDKDEPLEERCQIAYKATFDKTQEKDGRQLPSAHFETSYAGEIPVGMQAIHGESTEDILALCGPEADNAQSSRTSGPMMQRGIDNSPAIHVSEFTGGVHIEESIGSSEADHLEHIEVTGNTEANEEAGKSPPGSQTEKLIDDSRNRSINLEARTSLTANSTSKSQTPDENEPDRQEGERADASANSEISRSECTEIENRNTSELRDERGSSPTYTDRIEIFISPKSLSPVTVRRHRWSAERSFTNDKLICTLYEETVRDVTTADDSALYILEDNIHLPATERLESFVKLPSKKTIKPQAAKPLWTFNLSSLTPLTAQTGQVDEDKQTGVASLRLSSVSESAVNEQRFANESDIKDLNSEKEEIQQIDSEVKTEITDTKDASDRQKKGITTQNIDSRSYSDRKDHVTVTTEVYTEINDNNNTQKSQNNENSFNFDEDSFNQVLSNILSGDGSGQQSTLKVTSISHTSEMYSSDENMNETEPREAHVSETSVRSLPSASDSKQGLTVHGDVRSLDQLPDTADVEDVMKFPDTDYTSYTERETYGDDGENYSIFLGGGSTEREIERTEQFIRFETGDNSVQVVKEGTFSTQIGIGHLSNFSREDENSQSIKVTVSEEKHEDIDIESASEIAESERVVESSERETITSGEEGDDESDETNNNNKLTSLHESRWIDRTSKTLNVQTTQTQIYVKNAEIVEETDTTESHLNLKLSDSRDRRDSVNEGGSSETLSEGKSDRSSLRGDKELVSAQGSYPDTSPAQREEGEDLSSSRETNRDSLFRGTESTDLRDSSSAKASHPTHTSQLSTHSARCDIRGDNDSNISQQEGNTSGGNDKPGDIGEITRDDNTSVSEDISDSHAPVNAEQRVFTSSGEWRTQIHGSRTEYKAVETGDSIDDQQGSLSAPSAQVDSSSITSGLAYSESSEVGKLNAGTGGLNSSSLESAAVNDGMLINGRSLVEQHADDQKYANVTREFDGNENAIYKEAETFGGSSRRETDLERAVTVRGELDVSRNAHANIGESDNESSDNNRDNKIEEFKGAFIKFSLEDLPLHLKQRYELMDEARGRLTSVTDTQTEEIEYSSEMSHFDYDDWTRIEAAQEQIHFNKSTDDGLRLHGDFSVVRMGDITSSDEINRSKDSDTSGDLLERLGSLVHTDDPSTWQSKPSRVSVLVTGQVDGDMEENNNYEKEMDASYADDSDNSDLDTSGSQYSATVTCELRGDQRSMSPTSLDDQSLSLSEQMFGEIRDLPDGKSRLLSSASSDGYFSSASDQMTGELRLNVSSDAYRHYSSTSSEGYHSFISDQMTGELKYSPSSDVQKLSPSTFDEIEDTLNNSLMELENLSVNLSHDETDNQTQKYGEVHSSMRVIGGGQTKIQNMSDQRTVVTSQSGQSQRLGEVHSSMRVISGGETQIHNLSDQKTATTSISDKTHQIREIGGSIRVEDGSNVHRSVHSENRSGVRFVTENIQQSGYTSSGVRDLEPGQFQDAQIPSSEDREHNMTGNTTTSSRVDSDTLRSTDQTRVSFSQKYSSSDHMTSQFEQGGTEIPTWSRAQGHQTVYTERAGDQSLQRQFHGVDARGGQINRQTAQISGQSTQFSQTFTSQNTEIQYGGIIAGNLSSEERRQQIGQGGHITQGYSTTSSSMSDESRSRTHSSQSRTSVSSEHSQHTIMSSRDTETYENVPESMSEKVKDELLKKSHGYFSSSVSVNLSKKWKMFEKLYHSFDEFSWQGNLAPHLFTFVFQKSVENQTDVVDQFEKLYPLLLIEDVERCQNHICTVLYTDTYLKQRKMQKYFLRGFTKDLKRLWHSKRKQSLAPLCDIPEERIVSFSDCASVSLPTCHTTSIHPSLVSFQPVAKPQFNRFLQQGAAVDTSTSDNKGDNSFDSGEGNSCDSLQYICQGDLSDPTIMLSKRLRDLSRGDNSDILDDVLLRGLKHYQSKFMRFNPYMQVDRKGVRRTVRTDTIYEEEEDERYMD